MDTLGSFITGLVISATASATAVTGGAHATGGEQVTTGDSYSSVRVENVIHATNGGGTSYTKVETNTNGHIQTEEKTETFPPSSHSSVRVHVATSTIASTTKLVASSSVTLDVISTTASSSSTETQNLRARIAERVAKLFGQIWGWFSFTR